jgi:hypothetical protein
MAPRPWASPAAVHIFEVISEKFNINGTYTVYIMNIND